MAELVMTTWRTAARRARTLSVPPQIADWIMLAVALGCFAGAVAAAGCGWGV